jgi:nitroreductase
VITDISGTSALELLAGRQSALGVRAPGPGREAVETMLLGAMCAPDHGRLRPWRFLLIADQARNAFGAVMAQALAARRPGVGDDALARERAKALRAPLIIVVVAKAVERKAIPAVEQIIAAGIAANNILLVAHASGYAGLWRTGDAAYDPCVRGALGVDATEAIVGFLYLGTPEAMPPPRKLPDVKDFVRDWHGPEVPCSASPLGHPNDGNQR